VGRNDERREQSDYLSINAAGLCPAQWPEPDPLRPAESRRRPYALAEAAQEFIPRAFSRRASWMCPFFVSWARFTPLFPRPCPPANARSGSRTPLLANDCAQRRANRRQQHPDVAQTFSSAAFARHRKVPMERAELIWAGHSECLNPASVYENLASVLTWTPPFLLGLSQFRPSAKSWGEFAAELDDVFLGGNPPDVETPGKHYAALLDAGVRGNRCWVFVRGSQPGCGRPMHAVPKPRRISENSRRTIRLAVERGISIASPAGKLYSPNPRRFHSGRWCQIKPKRLLSISVPAPARGDCLRKTF